MPELPEVENIALGLRPVLVGRRVACVWVGSSIIVRGPDRRRWRQFMAELTGRRVESVSRRAKRLILTTEGGFALVFQLGMTGKFLLACCGHPARDSKAGRLRHGAAKMAATPSAVPTPKHTRLILCLRDAADLLFVDPRRFGRVWCLRDLDPDAPDAAMEAAGLTPLGPEALDVGPKAFAALLRADRPIKAMLLDQTKIAGLGNIYADESLWAAHIHPSRSASSLTSVEAEALRREIKIVLRRAIRAGGTTFSDFRNVYGEMGRFRDRLKVYGRQGETCPRCGTRIQYLRAAGRGTHVCPRCQIEIRSSKSEIRNKSKIQSTNDQNAY